MISTQTGKGDLLHSLILPIQMVISPRNTSHTHTQGDKFGKICGQLDSVKMIHNINYFRYIFHNFLYI